MAGTVQIVATAAPSPDWRLAVVLVVLVAAAAAVSLLADLGVAIGLGAVPVVALCLASGTIPLNAAGIIPIAGIVIGGAMTAATLAGRRALHELEAQRGAFEEGLALGLLRQDAAYLVIQPTAREALTPASTRPARLGWSRCPARSSVSCWVVAARWRPALRRCWC